MPPRKPPAKKHKALPPSKRVRFDLCEVGDRVRIEGGQVCVITAWLNNGPMGRWIDAEGNEGELVGLDRDQACRLIEAE